MQASVGLIRALGGGWSRADLPSEDGVLPFGPLDYSGDHRQPRSDGTDPDVKDASGVTGVYPIEALGIAIARAMAPGPSMSRLLAKLETQ